MSQIDILRPQDAVGLGGAVGFQDADASPYAQGPKSTGGPKNTGGLDFSFLEQQPQNPVQVQPTQLAEPVSAHSTQELDFSFLEEPVDDAAIAAQNVTHANKFTRQEVVSAGRHAKALGISVQEALQYADSAKTLARQADVDFMRQLSPRLVTALQGDAAYAAKDDITALNDMSVAFDDHAAGQDMSISPDVADSYLAQMPTGYYRKVTRMQEGMQQVGDALFSSVLGMVEGSVMTLQQQKEEEGPHFVRDSYANAIKDLSVWMRQKLDDERAGRAPVLPPVAGFEGYLEDVIKIAPQIISSVALGMAAPNLGAAFMASQITGSKYDELQQKGVDADRALAAALHSTLWQLPLEQISLDKFLDIFKASGTFNVLKAVGGATATEGITEWLQQYPDAAASIFAETLQKGGTVEYAVETFFGNFWEITKEGLYAGLVAAPYGAGFGAVHVASGRANLGKAPQNHGDMPLPAPILEALTQEAEQTIRMNQRQDFSTSLYQAAQAADNASLKQQDPEAMREVVEELIPEQFAQGWLGVDDAMALYQSAQDTGNTENLLELMGLDAQSLEDSIAKGAPLPISTAAVLVNASPANRQGLIDALRVSPDGPSGTEAKNFDPTARLETALADIRSSQKVHSEVQREVTRLKNEIIAAGHPAHVAESFAALHASQALAFHSAYGVDPVQLLARRTFMRDEGQSPLQDDAPQLNQAAMYRNRAASVEDFINAAMLEKGNDKSFYGLGSVERTDGQASGEVILTADNAKHIAARHPDFTEWGKIQETLANGIAIESGKNRITGDNNSIFVLDEGDKSLVVVAGAIESKKNGKRVYVVTAFKDSKKRVHNLIKKDAALYQSAGGSPAYPSPEKGAPSEFKSGVIPTMGTGVQKVNTLYQPINAGVDLDAPVQVVAVQPTLEGPAWQHAKGQGKAQLMATVSYGNYINSHTGKTIEVGKLGVEHSIATAMRKHDVAALEAIKILPELVQAAILVETHTDTKGQKDLQQIHRMYAPMQMGNTLYAVKLTVKEYKKTIKAEFAGVEKLYDTAIVKKEPSSSASYPSAEMHGSVTTPSDMQLKSDDSTQALASAPSVAISIHLRQLLAGVKDNDGNSFYQTDEQKTKRGKTTFTSDGRAEVRIFTQKDLSTIPHESMHIFLDDLMTVAKDDGTLALAEAQRRIHAITADAPLPLLQNVAELTAAIVQSPQQDSMQALRQAAVEVSQWAADAAMSAKTALGSVKAMQTESLQTDKPVGFAPWAELETQAMQFKREASYYSRVHTALKEAMAHMQGLEKARNDLETLLDWANVPPEADMHPQSEQYVPFHEAVAQGFEQYLMEGVAPSTKLRDVFSRIRGWILDVYKSARDALGLPITDDVRAVFDRMLATDKQMQSNRQLQTVLKSEDAFLESGQISYEEWHDLQEFRNQAEMEVQATMDRATLRDRATRRRTAFSEAKQFLEQDPFWQMVANISARTKNVADPTAPSRGGISKDSVARLIGAENTVELSRKRKGLINAKGEGMPLDLVAKEHGYEDEDAFINMLHDRLVTRGETITKLANDMADQSLQDADAEAEATGLEAGGQAYAKYLDKVDAVVLGMVARKGYRTEKEQQRFVYNSITPRNRIRQIAADELNYTPLRDISPERYHAMLGAALKDRQQALVKGDVMKALNAVEKARTANEMISLSRTILQRRQDVEALAARLAQAKQGTFPTVYREAMRKVLQQYNLGNMRGVPDAEFRQSNLEQVMLQTLGEGDATGVLPSFAPWILENRDPNTGKPMLHHGRGLDYRLLTPKQLQDIDNILRYLQKTGYDARTDLKNAEAAKVNLLVGQAAEAMAPLADDNVAPADTARRAVQDSLRGLSADVDALRWQIRKADGFSNLMGGTGAKGAMEEAILDKVLDGETRARSRLDSLSTAMAPALSRLAASVRSWEKQHGKNLALKDRNGKLLELPQDLQKAYGRKSWTADMVISLAFNVGNQSNINRITSFYRDLDVFTLEALLGGQVAARVFGDQDAVGARRADTSVQGLFTLQDWQDIQSIWDAIGSQWADTQAVHERMFGFTPEGVQATPLIITNAQGQRVALQGGYYPVRYDPKVSDRVAQWGEKEEILSRSESMFAVPSAKRGHTKAREEKTPELPLRLDTGVLMEHITDAVRFIELAEITRYADKVTQAPAFRHQYSRVYGKKDYDAIRPNLRALVLQEPPPKMEIARLANAVRKYLVPFGLAWNFKVAALQLTAVFPAMGDIGAKHVVSGMGHIAAHGMPAVRAVWYASPYMLSRKDNIDQDLQRNIANFNPAKRPASITVAGKELSWEQFVEAGMLPIVAVDTIATTSVWMGAYTKKLAELQGQKVKTAIDNSSVYHDTAVQYADTIVKQSNPDYDASSRSTFLRAQGMNRLVNMFSSATTLFAQRHKYMYTAHAKGQVTKWQLARFELFDTIIPATAVAMMLALARGMWPNDDDDDMGLFKFLLASIFDFTAMRLPVFGSIVSDGVMALAGIDDGLPQRGNLRTALDAPIQLFGTVTGRAGRAIYSEEINDEQAKRLVYAVGDIASFAARVPVAKIARNAERGYDQWQRGEGTPLSILLPRPGK